MKSIVPIGRLFLAIFFVLICSASQAQQLLTQTVTTTNRCCNNGGSVMDTSLFRLKTEAVILATPVLVNGVNQNPHPVAAYYMYLNSWSIFNLDGTPINVGAKYDVEYWITPDSNHFVFVVPPRNNVNDKAYIDKSVLNNHPNAQIRVFPRLTYIGGPGNTQNPNDVKMTYDAAVSKWYIGNSNGTPIPIASAYSIVVGNGAVSTSPNGNCNCAIPTTLPPDGPAGGDLRGIYPNPTVKGIQGNPVSNVSPAFGQVLKWDGFAWTPSDESGAAPVSSTSTSAKPKALYFNQSANLDMYNSNINSTAVPGLDNQVFTVAQNSRAIFNSVITVVNEHTGITIYETSPVEVWLIVELLNATNQVVGRSVSRVTIYDYKISTINSAGLGVLPAGTYHTHVTLNRPEGGSPISAIIQGGQINQGGQTIIEIIPD